MYVWTFMSVELRGNAAARKTTAYEYVYASGTFSGEDSDMNVQGTGIAGSG